MKCKETEMQLDYNEFINNVSQSTANEKFNFISLFSGAGIGDYGIKLAGGNCIAACELDSHRQHVHSVNIGPIIFGNIREEKDVLINHVLSQNTQIDLLIATPPCQSFSTANARRGKREDPAHSSKDDRNNLFFEALYIIKKLKPTVVIFENVPNFFKKKVHSPDGTKTDTIIGFLNGILTEYTSWTNILCMSDFGIPQRRKRSIGIFVLRTQPNINVLFQKLNSKSWLDIENKPLSIMDAIGHLSPLDSKAPETCSDKDDPLHQVPNTLSPRYNWIKNIPANSGKSAWENSCENCGNESTPIFEITCSVCNLPILVRPHVVERDGLVRSIKGFATSYKRINPNELAPTITTNTNSFSSDLKIHPNQNRVLSVREAALLQTIPYSFNWPEQQYFKSKHLIREMIGEAVPTLFTYQLSNLFLKTKIL